MQHINIFITALLAFTLIATMNSSLVIASPKQIELPPEKAKLRKSKLPGYKLATQQCLICHSADYISYQAPNMNQKQWTNEVYKMQNTFGAQFSTEDAKSIGAYLAVAYGTAKATDANIIAVSTTPVIPATNDAKTETKMDVQALLTNNGCLACHAINKKLVGPAFHEIATKYKSDPLAQAKLAVSIKKGSVGKWGNIPMPAMSSLNDAQSGALSMFVLKQ